MVFATFAVIWDHTKQKDLLPTLGRNTNLSILEMEASLKNSAN